MSIFGKIGGAVGLGGLTKVPQVLGGLAGQGQSPGQGGLAGGVLSRGIAGILGGQGGGQGSFQGIAGLLKRRQMGAQESPEAQGYFNTFSPEDQGNIRSSLARGGNLNDWFRNAQAAGAAPQTPTAPPMSGGGPFSGIAGAVANMVKMNQIKKQLPPKMNPDDEMGGGPAPY